jgi:hypothetical protein
MPKNSSRVLAKDCSQLIDRKIAIGLGNNLLSVWPRAITMWIVGLKHDVLDANSVSRPDRRRIIDGAKPEVAA